MSKLASDQNPNPAPSPEPTPAPSPAPIDPNVIHAQIEKARLEERTKVREELNNLSTLNKSLTDQLDKSQKDIQEVSSKLSALEKAQGANGEIDVSKLIAEVAAQTESKMAGVIEELKGKVKQLDVKSRKASLEVYRRDAIAKAGGEAQLITALVSGSSEEEIDSSIQLAKDEYQKIVSRVGTKVPTDTPTTTQHTNNGIGANVPPSLSANEGRGANVVPQPSIRELSNKEWGAKRDEILGRLRQGQNV